MLELLQLQHCSENTLKSSFPIRFELHSAANRFGINYDHVGLAQKHRNDDAPSLKIPPNPTLQMIKKINGQNSWIHQLHRQ